jgi:tetratricopeptide (TPR) repeat protein
VGGHRDLEQQRAPAPGAPRRRATPSPLGLQRLAGNKAVAQVVARRPKTAGKKAPKKFTPPKLDKKYEGLDYSDLATAGNKASQDKRHEEALALWMRSFAIRARKDLAHSIARGLRDLGYTEEAAEWQKYVTGEKPLKARLDAAEMRLDFNEVLKNGNSAYSEKRYWEAVLWLERAYELKPQRVIADTVSRAYKELGNKAKAEEWRKRINEDPDAGAKRHAM